MADDLQVQAEAVMEQLESRFGVEATYIKKGTPTVEADGDIVPNDTTIACTLVPSRVTQDDMTRAGLGNVEQSMQAFKARAAVVGTDISDGDEVTIASVGYQVVPPAILDPLKVTWRLLLRRIF